MTFPPPEFSAPPAGPMDLLRTWFDGARAADVRDPQHMALATADAGGHASNRIVAVIEVRAAGLVFASHDGSPKTRDLAETGWASGVLHWREADRQVIVSGPAYALPDADADALWSARSIATHPMSVASRQSELLLDEDELRARARDLASTGSALPRPATWLGYLLEPASVEFWQSGDPDRLYQRLLYRRDGAGWRTDRLQP